MEDSVDHQGLLASDSESEVQADADADVSSRIVIPKRKYIVEPVLFFVALLNFPFISLSTQYVLQIFREEIIGKNATVHTLNHSVCMHMNHSSEIFIQSKEVQSHSSYFMLMLNITRGVPAVFASLLLGPYSDQKGRKKVMYISLIGLCINITTWLVVCAFHLPKSVLFIGAFFEGLTGSMMAVLMACLTYVADITTHDTRAFRITIAELCLFIPMIISSVILGQLIEKLGFLWPFLMVLCGGFINITYITFFVPETVIPNPEAKLLDISHINKAVRIYTKDDGTGRRPKLTILLFVTFFAMLVTVASFGLNTLYVTDVPLCWDPILLGIYGATFMFIATVGGAVSARVLKICLTDVWIAMVSGILSLMGSVYTSFVQNTVMMFMGCFFNILFQVFVPTLRAIASKLVEPTENGALFCGISATEVLASVVGSAIFNPIYAKTNTHMHGFVYLTLACVQLIAISLLLLYILKFIPSSCRREQQLSVRCEDDIVENDKYSENGTAHSINAS